MVKTAASGAGTTAIYHLRDNEHIYFGDDNDASIHHDGTDTYFNNSTGNLILRGLAAGVDILLQPNNDTDDYFRFSTLTNVPTIFGVGAYLRIGDAAFTSQSLASEDDLLVTGKLEVDGEFYLDAFFLYFNVSPNSKTGSMQIFKEAGSEIFHQIMDTNQDQMIFTLRSALGRQLILGPYQYQVDFDHAVQTNPTLFIHSDTDPNTANDEWISFTHDVTDGVIDCGSGTLNLGGTANVNFAGATRTAVGDAVMNGYAQLEVAGTLYKFMLTA